eukprot:g9896.t1
MSSEEAGAEGGGSGGAVLDTSWINESAAGGSGGATSRGRGGSKRRTRRRTLSPSIGKHNYMSNVDFNDPMNFPSLPSSGGSKIPASNSCSTGSSGGADAPADDAAEGSPRLMLAPHEPPPPPPPPRECTGVAAEPPAAAAAGYSASPSYSATSQDADMPDPTVIADLFDVEGVPTPPPPGPKPLGALDALGNVEVVKTSSSSVTGIKKEAEPRSSGKNPRGSTARGRSNRRATFGGADTRVFLEAENLEPVLPSKPPARAGVDAAATAAAAAAAAAATRASPSTTTPEALVGPGQQQASDLTSAPQGNREGEEGIMPQPPAVKQKSRSRSSRRRSIVMPSEAQPLMDSDLDDGRAEHAAAAAAAARIPAPASPTSNSRAGRSAAGNEASAAASGDGKSKLGGGSKITGSKRSGSKKTTPSEELPLSSVNATSCLSRPLAAQRGWALGDQETRKQLFRAYYAADPGSQRARRIAARLFCLTGYPLSPVAPDDARALCVAAGGGMDWGLDETEPRLVSRPIRRETKEQKRVLVLRIKPLFELMEKASSEEKLRAEVATGVVSRKASPDGYRYEDRETRKPVDPDAYKVPYLEHVRAVRASRAKEFAAQRVTSPSPAPALPEAVCGSSPEAGVSASIDNGTVSSATAAEEKETEEEVGDARLEQGLQPTASATVTGHDTRTADVVVAEESPKEVGLPDDALAAVVGSDEVPLEVADAAATSTEEGKVSAGSNSVEAEDGGACVVGAVGSPAVIPDAGPRAPATPAPAVAGDGGSPVDAATRGNAAETPITIEEEPVAAACTVAEKDAIEGEAACAESDTPIVVAPIALLGGEVEDDCGEEDAAAEPNGETVGDSPSVVAGDEMDTPSSSSAAGDVCTPGAACASSAPVSTRPEGPEEGCDLCDAAIVSPASHVDHGTPHDRGADSSGEISSGRGGGMSSPHLSGSYSSLVLADDEGIVSPITASQACAELCQDEACGDGNPPTSGDSGQDDGSERKGEREAVALESLSPSPRRSGPSSRGSTEIGASDGEVAEAASSPFSISPAAVAAATSPPASARGYGQQQQEGLMSGRTPEPVERAQREFSSGERRTPPYQFSNAGSPAVSDIAASPGEDEEGAEEIGALKERLWAAWDAAVLEYERGVALVRSKYNRQASSNPVASTTTANEESAVVFRSPEGAADPIPTAKVAETSCQAGGASSSGPKAATTPAPVAAAGVEDVVAEEPAAAVAPTTADDGMPTPDSPLLPLLQLRLEGEEGDFFEYSSSWRGSGAGGDGSSQARGGETRRRSLAKAFSLQETRNGPNMQEEAVSTTSRKSQGAAETAALQTGEPEAGGIGGSDETAAVLCRLCCRKACDTVLRPCEHSACGVCVEKIRLQAEQSGQATQPAANKDPLQPHTMASHLRRPRRTGSDALPYDLAHGGQERKSYGGHGGDGSLRSAVVVPAGGDNEAGLLGASQDRNGNTSKKWNPFFSCNGEDNDPARVVVIKTPGAALEPSVSAAGQGLTRKPSKSFEGLLPRGLAKPTSASRKLKKAVQEGDDNAELAFSVPPSVKAALTRCAAQGRERVASGSATATGGGQGTRVNAQLATRTRSAGFRSSPVTPSLTPHTADYLCSTVSASSEDDANCHFFTTANSVNGGEGNGDAVGGGGGDGDSLACGKGGSSTEDKRNAAAAVDAVYDTRATEDGKHDRAKDVDGRRSCQDPEAPTCDEAVLVTPSGGHEPIGGGNIDQMLAQVLGAEGGEMTGPGVGEGRDVQCVGSSDAPRVPTSRGQDVGVDCCAKSSPGSAGSTAAAAAALTDNGGGGNEQRKLSRHSTEPIPVAPSTHLEAALACAKKPSTMNKASRVSSSGRATTQLNSNKASAEGVSRRALLEKARVAAVAGALAWTGVADEALAGTARPSARNLAETSIELSGTGKSPIAVSILYPKQWTVTKTPGKSINIQDMKYTDRAFSLSKPLPKGAKAVGDIPVSFFTDALFSLDGPYGTFGKVDDFKIIGTHTESKGKRDYRYVDLKFSAPTQGLLQVEKRSCVACTIVGDDVVIFTASVLASRWPKISPVVAEMMESYRADLPSKTPDPSSFAFNRL